MLTLEHVTKEYGNKTALADITLTFPDKGLVIVCGESGCGKTTLLNIASGADLPSFGKVFWCGCELNASNVEQFRRGKVSDVYQDFMLVDEMSCAENIRLAAEACGKTLSDDEVLTLLSRAGLPDDVFSKRVSLLSGGEKQRVAVARALVKDGAIVFADEPTGNLDRKNGETIMSLLREIADERLVIVVSHNERLNREYGQYSVVLEDGCVLSSDLPELPSAAQESPKAFGAAKPRLSPKRVVGLTRTGFEKNMAKCVFAAIAFLFIFAFSVIVNTLFICDLPLALASSLDSSYGKNLYFEPKPSDEGDDALFLELRDDASPVWGFGLNTAYLGFNPVFFNMPGISSLKLSVPDAIEYDPSLGADVDVVCGDFPERPDQVMLSVYFVDILLQSEFFGDCSSAEELIGRTLPVSSQNLYSSSNSNQSLTFKEYSQYIEFEISGFFSTKLPSDELAELKADSYVSYCNVIQASFLYDSAFVGTGYGDRIKLYRAADLLTVMDQSGSLVASVLGYDAYASYADSLPPLEEGEALIGDVVAKRLGVGVGDVISLDCGSVYYEVVDGERVPRLLNPEQMELTVTGIVDEGNYLFRDSVILSPEQRNEYVVKTEYSVKGFFFDFSDKPSSYAAVLQLERDINSVYTSSGNDFGGILKGRLVGENSSGVHSFFDNIYEYRLPFILPLMLVLLLCLVSLGAASFSFLISSKDKLYGVLRAIGYDRRSVFALMLASLSLLVVCVVVLGICVTALGLFLFQSYAGAPLVNAVVIPLAWHAVLLSVAATLISAVMTSWKKVSRLFSRTIAFNKSH